MQNFDLLKQLRTGRTSDPSEAWPKCDLRRVDHVRRIYHGKPVMKM